MTPFKVAVDRGIRLTDRTSSYPLDTLDAAGVAWSFLAENVHAIRPEQIEGWDAVIVGGSDVTPESVTCENPPLLIARLGAGFDNIAVADCSERGILVTLAPDGVRRAMRVGRHRLPARSLPPARREGSPGPCRQLGIAWPSVPA